MRILVRKIAKASVITIGSTIVYLGIAVSVNSLIGRTYGPEGLGLFTSFLMFVQLYSMFGIFGLPTALSKYTAEHEEKKEHIEIVKIFSSLIIFSTFSSIVIGIISRFLTPYLAEIMHIQSTNRLSFFTSVTLLFFSYSILCQALFQGLLKAFKSALIQNLSFLGILIVILYAYFFKRVPIYYAILFGYLASGILGIWLCTKEGVLKWQFDRKSFLKIVKFAIPIAVGSYVFFISRWVDRFVIGVFLGVKEIGIFTAAVLVVQAIQTIPLSLGTTLVPSYSKVSLLGTSKIEKAFNMNIKILASFLFFTGSILFLFASEIIVLIFGSEFSSASLILQILTIDLIFTCAILPAATLMTGGGFPKISALISSTGVFLQALFVILLTWKFGMIGTACARVLALPFLLALNLIFVKKVFKIKIEFKNIIIPAVITGFSILWFLGFQFLFKNKYFSGIIFVIVYIIITGLFVFESEDRELAVKILGWNKKATN